MLDSNNRALYLPKVSVIILTFNAKSTLGEVLDKAVLSALNQDYENLEVIIVDNSSTDGTYEYLVERYGHRARIFRLNKNYGFCLGNNIALKYISKDAKYILFQNPDAVLSKDYVSKLVELLERDPSIAAAQGLEIHPQRKTLRLGGSLNTAGYSVDLSSPSIRSSLLYSENLFVFGAALMVRRALFEYLGGFPGEFFMYFDEADLGFRLRALGFRLVGASSPKYVHYISGTVSRLTALHPVVQYFQTRNRLLVVLKFFYGKYLVKGLVLNLIILVTQFIRGPSVRRRVILKSLTYVARNLRRIIIFRRFWTPLLKKRKVLECFLTK